MTHFKKNLDTILDKNFLGLGLWLGSGHLLASAFLSDVVRPSFVGGCARRTTRTAFRGWVVSRCDQICFKTPLWGVLPSAKRPEGRAARGRPGNVWQRMG